MSYITLSRVIPFWQENGICLLASDFLMPEGYLEGSGCLEMQEGVECVGGESSVGVMMDLAGVVFVL